MIFFFSINFIIQIFLLQLALLLFYLCRINGVQPICYGLALKGNRVQILDSPAAVNSNFAHRQSLCHCDGSTSWEGAGKGE
jgi:hypothetical protein